MDHNLETLNESTQQNLNMQWPKLKYSYPKRLILRQNLDEYPGYMVNIALSQVW